jgi:hypothetical protein
LQDKELVAKLVSLAVTMLLPAHRCNQTNARNGKAHYNNAEVNATAHPLQTRCVLPYTVNANSMLIFNWNLSMIRYLEMINRPLIESDLVDHRLVQSKAHPWARRITLHKANSLEVAKGVRSNFRTG